MINICSTIYDYFLLAINNLFYRDKNRNEDELNIISIDLEWENILNEEL